MTKGSSIYLDVFRIICAQIILIGHALLLFQIFNFATINQPYYQSIAVTLLFVLSGYLTIYSVKIKANYTFKNFLISRFIRIYTVLFPLLIFIYCCDRVLIHFHPTQYAFKNGLNVSTFFANLFMLQNFPKDPIGHSFFQVTFFGSGATLWYLPVEWFCYMCFGFMYFRVISKGSVIFKIVKIIIFAFCLIVPIAGLTGGLATGGVLANGITFAFIAGIGIYYVVKQIENKISPKLSLVLFIVSILLSYFRIIYVHRTYATDYDPLFSVMAACIILFGIMAFKNIYVNKYVEKLVRFFAGYTYSLFVTQYTILVFSVIMFTGKISNKKLFVLTIIVANIFSILFALVFEKFLYKKLMKHLSSKKQ